MKVTNIWRVFFHWYEYDEVIKFEKYNPDFKQINVDTDGTTYEYRKDYVMDPEGSKGGNQEMREYIVHIPDDMHDYEELFVGNIRKEQKLIRCNECRYFGSQMESGYWSCGRDRGCVRTIPEGFCGWAVKRNEEDKKI